MNVKKMIGLSAVVVGMASVFGPVAYAVDTTTATVGVDDGSGNGNTPVFTLDAGGSMTFGSLDLSTAPTNGIYELAATGSADADVQVDDRRGLEDSDTSLPWRVQAIASQLKTSTDVVLPTTAFKLSLGAVTTGTGNNVTANSEVDILGAAANVGTATVGRGKTVFAPSSAKVNVAETAVKGNYSGTVTYTLVSGI